MTGQGTIIKVLIKKHPRWVTVKEIFQELDGEIERSSIQCLLNRMRRHDPWIEHQKKIIKKIGCFNQYRINLEEYDKYD